ncbi:hypothetical protein TIFTF001_029196 [Ficus carica]|uniref:Uncharacterized protein n=1 Tax=Ficus carica TaxID=3494 RepID=A0AA88DVB1_FICCA|nr:hypothetical protein TIFTF001_029196 [Ficus carica]
MGGLATVDSGTWWCTSLVTEVVARREGEVGRWVNSS